MRWGNSRLNRRSQQKGARCRYKLLLLRVFHVVGHRTPTRASVYVLGQYYGSCPTAAPFAMLLARPRGCCDFGGRLLTSPRARRPRHRDARRDDGGAQQPCGKRRSARGPQLSRANCVHPGRSRSLSLSLLPFSTHSLLLCLLRRCCSPCADCAHYRRTRSPQRQRSHLLSRLPAVYSRRAAPSALSLSSSTISRQ